MKQLYGSIACYALTNPHYDKTAIFVLLFFFPCRDRGTVVVLNLMAELFPG